MPSGMPRADVSLGRRGWEEKEDSDTIEGEDRGKDEDEEADELRENLMEEKKRKDTELA